jgi:hypothetical protein
MSSAPFLVEVTKASGTVTDDNAQHLEPSQRPSPSEIKSHPFFSSIEWSTLWTSAAPRIATGLTKPVVTLANVQPDSDIWAVFEDEVSDGGFPYDEEDEPGGPGVPGRPHSPPRPHAHRGSPLYDQQAAADAVASVDWPSQISGDVSRFDHESDLEPPRPAWIDGVPRKRGWSRGSHRTSSSGSGNRTALAGLLETMGIHNRPGSSRTSNSAKSDEARPLSRSSGQQAIHPQDLQQRLASDLHESQNLAMPQANLAPGEEKWQVGMLSHERRVALTGCYQGFAPSSQRTHHVYVPRPRQVVGSSPLPRQGAKTAPTHPDRLPSSYRRQGRVVKSTFLRSGHGHDGPHGPRGRWLGDRDEYAIWLSIGSGIAKYCASWSER